MKPHSLTFPVTWPGVKVGKKNEDVERLQQRYKESSLKFCYRKRQQMDLESPPPGADPDGALVTPVPALCLNDGGW